MRIVLKQLDYHKSRIVGDVLCSVKKNAER
jgi:hypothetical protein